MPAIRVPTNVQLARFVASQTNPQLGTPRATSVGGSIDKKPQSGPRRYQGAGQVLIPTQKPISIRAE